MSPEEVAQVDIICLCWTLPARSLRLLPSHRFLLSGNAWASLLATQWMPSVWDGHDLKLVMKHSSTGRKHMDHVIMQDNLHSGGACQKITTAISDASGYGAVGPL